MKDRIMYVELKSGYNDDGPAWIGRVSFSKTGRTVYYRGRTLQRKPYGGGPGNHFDVETGEEFWISGVKKSGQDRHWAGKGTVEVDEDARDEYTRLTARPSSPKAAG
ncbi:MAG TPA: hypothetical protein VHC63_13195 [Acidimicrobiales bacterium]|nr:hypothetical protein [Acidimicrobiales bacterium]